ncbi:MAG: hypothetical protein WC624_05490 [Candidatus Margulisiibacteriota bacterium]
MTEFSFGGTAKDLYNVNYHLDRGAVISNVKGRVVLSDNNILDLQAPNLAEKVKQANGFDVIPHEIKLTV